MTNKKERHNATKLLRRFGCDWTSSCLLGKVFAKGDKTLGHSDRMLESLKNKGVVLDRIGSEPVMFDGCCEGWEETFMFVLNSHVFELITQTDGSFITKTLK